MKVRLYDTVTDQLLCKADIDFGLDMLITTEFLLLNEEALPFKDASEFNFWLNDRVKEGGMLLGLMKHFKTEKDSYGLYPEKTEFINTSAITTITENRMILHPYKRI